MAETICRALRDGALEGEHAPALTIKDSIDSPFGPAVFNHVLAQLSSYILAGKSQSRGLVLVVFSRSPTFYADLLKDRGTDVASSHDWFRVLDCYTDPLGWKGRLRDCGSITNPSPETSVTTTVCKDVRNLDELLSSILESGKGLIGEGKNRISVAIDSVSEMLRHTSMSAVASLLSSLRSHEQVSSVFWLLHSDLQGMKAASAFEYMSSMLANIETLARATDAQRDNCESLSLLEQNSKRAKFHVRLKRRNGRVRAMSEELSVEKSGIKFSSASSVDGMTAQSLVPKVQFNLQLSEKERIDRARVVLPFEHQGNGKSVQIYDGRRSLNEDKVDTDNVSVQKVQMHEDSGRGEIIYFRDSDDERPDSDEDPDDDLDI